MNATSYIPVSTVAVKTAVTFWCHPSFSKLEGAGSTPLSHYWVDSKVSELAGVFSSISFPCCLPRLVSFVSKLFCIAVVPSKLSHGSMCWTMSNREQMDGLCLGSFKSQALKMQNLAGVKCVLQKILHGKALFSWRRNSCCRFLSTQKPHLFAGVPRTTQMVVGWE